MRYGQRATLSDGYFENFEEEQLSYKVRASYKLNKEQRVIADVGYYDKKSTYRYDAFNYVCTEFDPDCDLNKGERIKAHRVLEQILPLLGLITFGNFHQTGKVN